jgi:hypothetical protein
MDEKGAVDKIRQLKLSVDTTLRYWKAGAQFQKVFLIILSGILAVSIFSLWLNVYNLEIANYFLGSIKLGAGNYLREGFPDIAIFFAFAVIVYKILHKPFKLPVGNEWDEYLKEGVPGIIRIIETTDWEEMLVNLKKAKLAFIVISAMIFLLYLGITFILFFFAYGLLLGNVLGIPINLYIVLFGSILLVIALGDRSIRQRYNELWHMDSLVAELRWFYTEFQNARI